jgi:hypothetical protein
MLDTDMVLDSSCTPNLKQPNSFTVFLTSRFGALLSGAFPRNVRWENNGHCLSDTLFISCPSVICDVVRTFMGFEHEKTLILFCGT